eukprot:CAMPEP_0184307048 /NCGR_PEP_ID=MMETSP1049-20130417/15891_1 /TAXON_ID=77928 /ORGANISM="Proteomonas sulcata, Strain CCMP704" /LENGTH=273 /DNA_ID=CAMNT_0026619441 /DNA_START=1 /DNA_END=822 /DNA_ORIENTATION=+
MQLSMANSKGLTMPVTPDIMILPSQLAPFAKRAGDVLCVNPGRLAKGQAGGTFAKLSVHPILRNIRSGGSRKITAGLNVTPPGKESPSDLTPSPGSAENGAAVEQTDASASKIMPQKLSENFESAVREPVAESAADTSSKSDAAGMEVDAAAGANSNKEAHNQDAGAEEDKMQTADAEVKTESAESTEVLDTVSAEGEQTAEEPKAAKVPTNTEQSKDAESHSNSAAAEPSVANGPTEIGASASPIGKTESSDKHVETLHRVLERTRVDIIKL